MKKILFTFNFKKLPKAATIAILFIALIEAGSWFSLRAISRISSGGDLVRMDSDFFNRNLSKYDTDLKKNKQYVSETYNSWKECWADAPYDVIVAGDSTGNTGWAKMLQLDYGVKTLITTGTPSLNNGIISAASLIIGNYKNKNVKAILLEVGLTEREGYNYKNICNVRELIKKSKDKGISQDHSFPSIRLSKYIAEKVKSMIDPRVEIVDIKGKPELFYAMDIKGLAEDINYSVGEYSKFCEQLKQMKDIAAEKGLIYAIIAFPTKPQQYEWLLIKVGKLSSVSKRRNLNILKEACKRNNIPFLDIEEKLDPIAKQVFENTGKLLWYRCDTHMNELGAYYSANIINAFLSEIRKEHL